MTNTFIRSQGRGAEELRPWKITRGVLDHAEGSALIETGKTRVMCAASVEDKVPAFLRNEGKGWVTAEYSMLPRSTHTRSPRDRGEGSRGAPWRYNGSSGDRCAASPI